MEKVYTKFFMCLCISAVFPLLSFSQSATTFADKQKDSLQDVTISFSRIDMPFSRRSRTMDMLTAEDIDKSGYTSAADAFQQIAGVDARRRGLGGMQADLYIRGGSFDQTLLLIDGMKMDDAQTGHHTMNLALPPEMIRRVEVIKGPAARIFGQNAFSGAINISALSEPPLAYTFGAQGGSFGQINGSLTAGVRAKRTSHIFHFSTYNSDGYRHNTDFHGQNAIWKIGFNKKRFPVDIIALFSNKHFGANGFYASSDATEQYESTQSYLLGISTTITKGRFTFKPKAYWRRNNDEYLYIRKNPSYYRNIHVGDKIAQELNVSYRSLLGITGFGLEFSNIFISSSSLGDRHRFIGTAFLEHRFDLFRKKLDITPGVSVSYFSDFLRAQVFPGIDAGYQLGERLRIYGNVGYTYRLPTYTDLYYISPEEIGNPLLQAERALSEEVGAKWEGRRFAMRIALFNRDAFDIIDYIKVKESDKWQSRNIQNVHTKGIEWNGVCSFFLFAREHKAQIGYAFIHEDLGRIPFEFSRYSLNSMRHQLTFTFTIAPLKNTLILLNDRFIERTSGYAYHTLDVRVAWTIKQFELSCMVYNVLDAQYTETNLIPMPGIHAIAGVRYHLKDPFYKKR